MKLSKNDFSHSLIGATSSTQIYMSMYSFDVSDNTKYFVRKADNFQIIITLPFTVKYSSGGLALIGILRQVTLSQKRN